MTITCFKANNFRNLESISLALTPQVNLFFGENASGKTNLLEAIYYLGLGRSFRTHLLDRVICREVDGFSLFAYIQKNSQQIPIGMERSRSGIRKIRIDGEDIQSLVSLARYLPIQFIGTNCDRFFTDGAKLRGQYIDWGVFHIEPCFYSLWQNLQKGLRQRNEALRKNQPVAIIRAWDAEISTIANQVDDLRRSYVQQLLPIMDELLQILLKGFKLNIQYYRGWPETQELIDVWQADLIRDQMLGYTQKGPHRADLKMTYGKIPVHQYLSQGQLKLLTYAVKIAQGIFFNRQLDVSPIYLIDDLPAELDKTKRYAVASILEELCSQVFVTGNVDHELQCLFKTAQTFHVEQGKISLWDSYKKGAMSSDIGGI